jgi:L,D-peptidoglycan transpeptidase YkuD (ErfK/YbiS/YcfS/YnhG family)
LKRADRLYDLVLVLGYNDVPRIMGMGSAIFIHLARPGFTPADGCLALSRHDFLMLLAQLRRDSTIWILP